MDLNVDILLELKEYLKQQIDLKDDFETIGKSYSASIQNLKNSRKVIASLMVLMCEFDSLSTDNSILQDIYKKVEINLMRLFDARLQIGTHKFLWYLKVLFNNA